MSHEFFSLICLHVIFALHRAGTDCGSLMKQKAKGTLIAVQLAMVY